MAVWNWRRKLCFTLNWFKLLEVEHSLVDLFYDLTGVIVLFECVTSVGAEESVRIMGSPEL